MKQIQLKKIAEDSSKKIKLIKDSEFFFEDPFTHFYINNFFDKLFVGNLLESFPSLDSNLWDRSNDPEIEVKMRSNWKSEFDCPENIVNAIRIMNSAPFLTALSNTFNIPKLMPDPYFTGGGLNVTVSGGLLDVHVDGNYHDASGLHRRVNAILYLNPGWKKYWGGEFGLYDKKGEKLVKKIAPLHNRFMAFDTNDFSFHGLPERQVDKVYNNSLCAEHDCELGISDNEDNLFCYKASCYETALRIAKKLNLNKSNFTVCFQSRLGRGWLEPFSDRVIENLAKEGKKKILIFSPAFVSDCLETIIEIGDEYQEIFEENGGEKVQLVESLNDNNTWVDCLEQIVIKRTI